MKTSGMSDNQFFFTTMLCGFSLTDVMVRENAAHSFKWHFCVGNPGDVKDQYSDYYFLDCMATNEGVHT